MRAVFALIVGLLLVGCETNGPRRPTVVHPTFELVTSASASQDLIFDDVGISLRPIMAERAKAQDGLFSSYSFWNPANPKQGGSERRMLVSLPAFEVQVTNATPYPLQFQKTSVRLIDDAGNSYQAVLKQDVADALDRQLNAVEARGWRVDRAKAMEAVRGLRLFDKNFESLPNISEKRILAFDLENMNNVEKQVRQLSRTKYLRVVFFNVPFKFDAAGNSIKSSKFEYLFDVVRR